MRAIATGMATMTSSEDIEDNLSVSDITVQNAAPANRYTEEFDDIDSDELDDSRVVVLYRHHHHPHHHIHLPRSVQ